MGPLAVLLLLLLPPAAFGQDTRSYQYFLSGDARDVQTKTTPGYLLAGGGKDEDEAVRWFLERSGGGDVVVLRASGTDAYNPYFHSLAKLDSVETIIFKEPAAARDPFVLERIRGADALFLAGGDQWNYLRYWQDTPVQAAINRLIQRGVPVGGTSAGLAVLGEFSFSAKHDTVTSAAALANPFDEKVSLASGFLELPHLGCLITDSHFSQRDRMGRLLVFLARIRDESNRCAEVRAIAVDERATVRLDRHGHAIVSGEGAAFFLKLRRPAKLTRGVPASIPPVSVSAVPTGGAFDLERWSGQPQTVYQLTTSAGRIQSSLADGGLYGGGPRR